MRKTGVEGESPTVLDKIRDTPSERGLSQEIGSAAMQRKQYDEGVSLNTGVEGESQTVKEDTGILTCYWLRHGDKCRIKPDEKKRPLPCLYYMDLIKCKNFEPNY